MGCSEWSTSSHPCDFPYTGDDCDKTFAEAAPGSSYLIASWLYRIWFILVLIAASVRMYYLALDHGRLERFGLRSKLYKRRSPVITANDYVNIILFAVAIFQLIQAIDLYSWSDVVPYGVSFILREATFASASAAARIIVVQWITLVYICTHPLSRGKKRSRTSVRIFWVTQISIWCAGFVLAFTAIYVDVSDLGSYNGAIACADSMIYCIVLLILLCIALVYAWRLTNYLASDEEEPLKSDNSAQREKEDRYAWDQARQIAKIVFVVLVATSVTIGFSIEECVSHATEIVYESPPCSYSSAFFRHPSVPLMGAMITAMLEMVPARRKNDAEALKMLASRFRRASSRSSSVGSFSESEHSDRPPLRSAASARVHWLLFGTGSGRSELGRDSSWGRFNSWRSSSVREIDSERESSVVTVPRESELEPEPSIMEDDDVDDGLLSQIIAQDNTIEDDIIRHESLEEFSV